MSSKGNVVSKTTEENGSSEPKSVNRFIHSIGFNRTKPKIKVRECFSEVIDPKTNVVTVVKSHDEISKYRLEDFDRRTMLELGIPMEEMQLEMPRTLATEAVNSMIESFNQKVTNNE